MRTKSTEYLQHWFECWLEETKVPQWFIDQNITQDNFSEIIKGWFALVDSDEEPNFFDMCAFVTKPKKTKDEKRARTKIGKRPEEEQRVRLIITKRLS